MDKTQAAKLAQAYQWLSEGKEVEWRYNNGEWEEWNGFITFPPEFRIKPDPRPILDGWANVYPDHIVGIYSNPESARTSARSHATRIAVHMREVREPDIKTMVERFMKWKLAHQAYGICMNHEEAEQMIRHILGEDK